MFLPIRYAPSGPPISNPEGGEPVPGIGFPLRFSDAQASTGLLVLTASQQPIPDVLGDFALAIENPAPDKRYRARMLTTFNTSAASRLSFGAEWQVDGAGWTPIPSGDFFIVDQAAAAANSTALEYATLLTLGAALPSPVLPGSALLEVRFTASVNTGGGGAGALSGPKIWGELLETL